MYSALESWRTGPEYRYPREIYWLFALIIIPLKLLGPLELALTWEWGSYDGLFSYAEATTNSNIYYSCIYPRTHKLDIASNIIILHFLYSDYSNNRNSVNLTMHLHNSKSILHVDDISSSIETMIANLWIKNKIYYLHSINLPNKKRSFCYRPKRITNFGFFNWYDPLHFTITKILHQCFFPQFFMYYCLVFLSKWLIMSTPGYPWRKKFSTRFLNTKHIKPWRAAVLRVVEMYQVSSMVTKRL